MGAVEKARQLRRKARKELDKAEAKRPSHDTLWKMEELERHASQHKALNYLETTKNPEAEEVMDLLKHGDDDDSACLAG